MSGEHSQKMVAESVKRNAKSQTLAGFHPSEPEATEGGRGAGKYRGRLAAPRGVPGEDARLRWRGGAGGGRARPAA